MNMPLPELSEIHNLRIKLKINQLELSKQLNIPQATLSRIERGKGNPSYLTVKKIFEYLETIKIKKEKTKQKAKDVMTKNIISIKSNANIKDAVNLMNDNNLSQIPVIDKQQNRGSITAKKIQKFITDRPDMINASIDLIQQLPFPEIEKDWDIKDISNLLTTYPAVLVKDAGRFIGIITDADLLKIV